MKTARWRRCRAFGKAWLTREGEGVAAELLDRSERRGGDGERDYGGETATSSSAMVRERVRETRGRVREDERGAWGSRGIPGRLQASAEAGGGRRGAAGTGHALRVLLAGGG